MFFFELGPKSASGSPKSTQLNEDNIYAVFYDEAFQSVLIDSLDTKSTGTFIVRIFLSAKNVYFQNFKIAFLFPPKLLHSTIIHFENSKTDKKWISAPHLQVHCRYHKIKWKSFPQWVGRNQKESEFHHIFSIACILPSIAFYSWKEQEHPSRGVLEKRCSENTLQIPR